MNSSEPLWVGVMGGFAWSLWYFFKHDAVVMPLWGQRQPFPVNQRLSVARCFPHTLFITPLNSRRCHIRRHSHKCFQALPNECFSSAVIALRSGPGSAIRCTWPSIVDSAEPIGRKQLSTMTEMTQTIDDNNLNTVCSQRGGVTVTIGFAEQRTPGGGRCDFQTGPGS